MNDIAHGELEGAALEALQRRLRELEEENLDLKDEVERLEDQQDVLENFLFGLEREHEEARQLVDRTKRRLQESFEELRELKEQQDELLETMEEGLIAIDADGRIGTQHSRAALRLLGADSLAGRRLSSLFEDERLAADLDDFIEMALGAEHASNRMLASLNPLDGAEVVIGGEQRRISANVVRFVSGRSGLPKLLLALHDRTEELRLEAELQAQAKVRLARIERAHQLLLTPPALYDQVGRDAEALLRHLRRPERDQDLCRRLAHALKGDARAMGLDGLAETVHELEDALDTGSADTLREVAEQLKRELDEDSSLLDRFAEMRARARSRDDDPLHALLQSCVDREADARGVAVTAMVRSDIDRRLHARLLDRLRSPILALARNAVAHGGEAPEERSARGKPEALRVELVLEKKGSDLVVRVRDDGRGIDFDAVGARAVTLGVLTPDDVEGLSRDDLAELLFLPRFSTRETPDLAAGRGMGMDIVRATVQQLGGTVALASEPGVYTECHFRFPIDSLEPAREAETRRAV